MTGRWLLIDDIRDLNCDVTARTWRAGIEALRKEKFQCLCLDHDLGEEDVNQTGYTLLVQGLEEGVIPDRVQLVTSNPVGRDNMKAALLSAGYRQPSFNVSYFVKE